MLKFYDVSGGYLSKKDWADDGNGKFAKVYFRINTIGFNSINGCFENEADIEVFRTEISEIIKQFDVVEESEYRQTKENLYAHPNNISGVVAKSKIKPIAEAIDNSKTMEIRWVDVYEEYSIISDEDYVEILNNKRQAMAFDIVEKCATKRINQFYNIRDIAKSVMEKFKENRLDKREDINTFGMTFRYAVKIIQQLVENGFLTHIEQNGEYYIRSFNKTEQKKNKVDYSSVYVNELILSDVSLENC